MKSTAMSNFTTTPSLTQRLDFWKCTSQAHGHRGRGHPHTAIAALVTTNPYMCPKYIATESYNGYSVATFRISQLYIWGYEMITVINQGIILIFFF